MAKWFVIWTVLMGVAVVAVLATVPSDCTACAIGILGPLFLWIVGLMGLIVVGVARQDRLDEDKPQLVCESCGTTIYGRWWDAAKGGYVCRLCGTLAIASAVDAAPLPTGAGSGGPPLAWPYQAKTEEAASLLFQADATRMAAAGYQAVSKTWTPGRRGAAPILAALFLSLWLIGIPILIYLMVVTPKRHSDSDLRAPPS